MTFPVPSVAGVFLSLSDRLKTAITDGSAAHYLLGRNPTRLRNHLGFHAALAEMADALLERAVLPYQITSSLSSLTVLPTAQLSGTDVLPVQIEAKTSLPALLATVAKRAKLGTEKRYAPLEFWRAILDGINSLSSSQGAFLWPRNAASEDYADVVIYPSICRVIGDYVEGMDTHTFIDLFDAEWLVGSNFNIADVVVKDTNTLVCWSFDRGTSSAYMLSKLGFDFEYETETWHMIFAHFWLSLIGSPSAVVEREQIPSLPSEKLDAIANWSPMEPLQYYDIGRKPTARPNLDLLRVYQILLCCFWANWARMKVQIKVPHLVTTRTVVYTVNWDGSLTTDSDSTETDVTMYTNKLEWTHDVSWSTNGEWSREHTYNGGITYYLSLSLLTATEHIVNQSSGELPQGYESAIETYFQKNADVNAVRSIIKSYLDGVWQNHGGGWVELIVWSGGSGRGTDDIHSRVSVNSSFTDAPADELLAALKELLWYYDCSGATSLGALVHYSGGGFSWDSVTADASIIQSLKDFSDAARAFNALGGLVGYKRDITNILRKLIEDGDATVVWDGGVSPEEDAADYPRTTSLTVVSSETHPVVESGGSYLRALIMTGSPAAGSRTSPWPARSVIDGSYVKSEKTALGARFRDDIRESYDESHQTSRQVGYYNYVADSSMHDGAGGYRATRGTNGSGERAPTGNIFRRLMVGSVDMSDGDPAEAPSASVEELVASLIESPNNNITMPTGVGGTLPMSLLGIFPHGAPGEEPDDGDNIYGVTHHAWYHRDLSPKIYYIYRDGRWEVVIVPPGGEAPAGAVYSYYLPYCITRGGEEIVIWAYSVDGTTNLTIHDFFTYYYYGKSPSGSAATLPNDDRLVVDLSRHLAVRAEWNWKSMPVTHN